MQPVSILLAAGCLVATLAGPAAAEPPGRWVSPLGEPPRVVRAFRPPVARWAPGHRGVDLAGSPQASVRSAGAGRVSFAGLLAGRGVVVVVHGELRTSYEPVAPTVRVGDRVAAGAPIGRLRVGHDPGRPTAAVLHWGLLRGETYLDPMALLRGRPVRLLPRWRAPPRAGAPPLPAAAGRAKDAPAAVRAASVEPAAVGAASVEPATAPPRPGRTAARSSVAAAALVLLAAAGAGAVIARAPPPG